MPIRRSKPTAAEISTGMQVCFDAWNKLDDGYVFICTKGRDDTTDSGWKEYPFSWPKQKQEILSLVIQLSGKPDLDLYWSILTFSRPKRREELVNGNIKVLYADLDPVDPEVSEMLGDSLRPSVAWKSSDNRFQALWYLKSGVSPSAHRKLNSGLTYHCGADKGGWDITQVLRIPCTANYKYQPFQVGKILWTSTSSFDPEKLKAIQALDVEDSDTTVMAHATTGEFVKLLSKYHKIIPSKVSRMLQYPDSRVTVGKRSEILWYLESELISCGVPLPDVVSVISGSAWNKFSGRRDEMKRLTIEVEKVYRDQMNKKEIERKSKHEKLSSNRPSKSGSNQVANAGNGGDSRYEDDDNPSDNLEPSLPIVNFSTFMGGVAKQPGWMIKDIWLRRSHGIIAGDPKTFKSTVAMDIAVSVASGLPLWGEYPVEDQGPVIIIQNENSDWIVRQRMEAIMAAKGLLGSVSTGTSDAGGSSPTLDITFAPDLPIAFLNNWGFNLTDPLHMELLEDYLQQIISSFGISPSLIMFDPLYLMFDGELSSAKEVNPALQWLMSLKNKYNSSIMLVHHWNKNGVASRGGQRMLGSVALHGWTESGLFIRQQVDSTVEITGRESSGTGDPGGKYFNRPEGVAAGPGKLPDGPITPCNIKDVLNVKMALEREMRAAGILPEILLKVVSVEVDNNKIYLPTLDQESGGKIRSLLKNSKTDETPNYTNSNSSKKKGRPFGRINPNN
jgi:hypothetical protein